MVKNSKKKILLSVLSLALICGFSSIKSNVITDDVKFAYSNADDSKVASVKEAITKLANSKNYTISVSTKTGPLNIENNMFFTENAFYDDYLGDEYGYCKIEDGVFRFDRYARKFTPSALLKNEDGSFIKDIWGNGFFYGFNDLDLSEFDGATGKSFTCTKKKNKLVFMKMFSIDQSKYSSLKEITITVDDDVNTVAFDVSLVNGEEHNCKIKDFGKTKIDYLDAQLDKGKTYYQPDETMQKVIDLFAGLNYTHLIYDPSFDEVNPVGYEKFTKDYFISGYSSEYLKNDPSAIVKCSGMIGFDNYKVNDDVTLNGSYWTYLFGDTFSMITSFPYNEDPYVPNVYVYPTFLKALSQSQYFTSSGIEGSYYTSKISVISDFCTNFQLWESLQAQSFIPCGLFIEYSKNYNNQDTVTFKIEYDYYGYIGTTDFVFSDFGTTSEEMLDNKYVTKYINAYYNGSKPYVNVEGFEENKRLTVKNSTEWLRNDDVVEAYEYVYFKNAAAGSKISLSVKNGDNYDAITVTPYESDDNDNYVVINGEYKIKETANTSIFLYKMKDGSWKFVAKKVS